MVGPEDVFNLLISLSFSWAQLRRPSRIVPYAVIDETQLRAGLSQAGLPARIVEAMVEIKTTFVQGNFDILTSDVERLSGRPPKSLRDVFASMNS